jgi:acetyl esterase/lipase
MSHHGVMARRTRLAPAGLALALGAGALLGCEPSGTRYVDQVFAAADATRDVQYATAPDLVTGSTRSLTLDWFEPRGDTRSARPVVVWIHGGGFRTGTKAATAEVAEAYARRGYVTLSIGYRLDPGNRCQDVQDGRITDPNQYAVERARCERAILAAQHDAQGAIRWARANAGPLDIDRGRIAVGGFSAGAVTAVHVAQRSEDPGDVGDHDGRASSVGAALAASGCNYDPGSIAAGDAPVFLLASEHDQAVPFSCVRDTEARSRAAGIPVGTRYYFGEATHAKALYEKYRADVDAAWTAFLVDHLELS